MKTCSKCNTPKDGVEFNKRKRSPDGFAPWCKLCSRQYDKDNRERFKPLRTDRWYIRTYGITHEEFKNIVASQEGRCAICTEYMVEPHLDHDHATGKIRAALCHKCNVGLGHFNDCVELLRKALKYLEGQLGKEK